MSYYEPPSEGSKRCMIYRIKGRTLVDGCDDCGLSLTYCQARRDIERAKCCDTCQHDHPNN